MIYHAEGVTESPNSDFPTMPNLPSPMPTPEQVEAWTALCEAATPGPWWWLGPDMYNEDMPKLLGEASAEVCAFGNAEQYYPTEGTPPSDADQAFIATARTALPALLSAYRVLREENERLRERTNIFANELAELIREKNAVETRCARRNNQDSEQATRNQRIVDLVTAKGSEVSRSPLTGNVVVVDGRTGLDASEKTADEAFDSLFREMDGEGSPPRIDFVLTPDGPSLRLRPSTPQASPNDTPARASHVGNGEDSERLRCPECGSTEHVASTCDMMG